MAIQLPDILAPKQPPLHPADMPMEEDVTVSEVQQPLPQEGIVAPSAQQAQGGVAPAAQGGILDQFTDTSGIGVSRRSPFNAQGLNTYNRQRQYTNEDFYGPRGPDIYATDPRGAQMYIPRAGELPLGLWASRMQAVQGDLAQTRKGIGDLMKDTGMPKTADPYQADFTRLVTGAQQKYIDGIAAQYGGDTAMAYQEISTDGSPANLGWKRLMANADAIGQHVKGEWDQTGQWAKQLVEGKVNADPEMVQMAHEYLHGVGGLSGNSGIGDFEKAVKNTGRIRMEMGLDYFANQLGDKMVDEAYATVKNDLQRGISMGQRVIDEKTIKSVEDGIYKALVDRAVDYTPSIDSPEGRARAERYFRFRYPQVKELKKELRYVNLPDGSSSAGGGANTPVGTRMDATPRTSIVSGKHPLNEKAPFDAGVSAPAITISTKVGNIWRPLDKVDVADGSGEYRMMVQPRFTYKDGEYVIAGKMMDRTSELAITDALKKEGIDYDLTKSAWDNMTTEQRTTVEKVVSKYTKNESVPLRYNQDILSRNSGFNTGDEIFSAYLNQRGHKVSPDEVGKMMSTPEGRRKVNEMMGFAPQKQSSAPAKAEKADVVSLAKANNVAFDQNIFDSWPKEKQDAFIAKLQTGAQTTATTSQSPKDKSTSSATIAKPVVSKEPTATKQASPEPPSQGAKEDEAPVVHSPKAVRDTLSATSKKQGYEAMRDRVDANYKPGTYQYKNQQQADDSMQARRVAKDPDPKGFFTEGVVVESKIGDKKVFYIMDKTGMRPLSDYFEDKESAGLVLDAFNKGEIHEEFLSKRSRSTKQAFEKLLNAK